MKLIGLGRLTADPEVQQTSGGTSFCRFSLADNEVRTSKQTGEKIETVHFFDFIIWDTAAETFAKYCKKGNQLYVECSALLRS
jgi:single-strand DNA-binding protein